MRQVDRLLRVLSVCWYQGLPALDTRDESPHALHRVVATEDCNPCVPRVRTLTVGVALQAELATLEESLVALQRRWFGDGTNSAHLLTFTDMHPSRSASRPAASLPPQRVGAPTSSAAVSRRPLAVALPQDSQPLGASSKIVYFLFLFFLVEWCTCEKGECGVSARARARVDNCLSSVYVVEKTGKASATRTHRQAKRRRTRRLSSVYVCMYVDAPVAVSARR